MKTINYTFAVWITVVLLSPIIFCVSMFFINKNNWYVRFDDDIFCTYSTIVLDSCIVLSLNILIFLLVAGYLSVRDDLGIRTRKIILSFAALLGLIPFFYFLIYVNHEKILILLSLHWVLLGTLSTFLYSWQPEKD